MSGEAFANAKRLLPWHFTNAAGELMWRGVGDLVDEAAARLRDAWRCRLTSQAPTDALPLLSDTRNLDYPAGLAVPLIRERLADPWTLWENAGSRQRLQEELATFGLLADVVSWRDLLNQGIPLAFGGDSSCFYLVARGPHRWKPARRWDAANTNWDDPDLYWDLMNHDPVWWAQILKIIAKWKPATSSCRYVEVWLRVDLFGNPVELARLPVYEEWELDDQGNATDYYNGGYL